MYRGRWLAALVPKSIEFIDYKAQSANDMKMPSPAPRIGRNNSMAAADCVQEHFQNWKLHELISQQDAIDAMSRCDFLPVKHQTWAFVGCVNCDAITMILRYADAGHFCKLWLNGIDISFHDAIPEHNAVTCEFEPRCDHRLVCIRCPITLRVDLI